MVERHDVEWYRKSDRGALYRNVVSTTMVHGPNIGWFLFNQLKLGVRTDKFTDLTEPNSTRVIMRRWTELLRLFASSSVRAGYLYCVFTRYNMVSQGKPLFELRRGGVSIVARGSGKELRWFVGARVLESSEGDERYSGWLGAA